jgi:Xaa-Pro aminopeptidase
MIKRHLTPDYFRRNRQALLNMLGEGSLAIVCAGRPPRKTADEHYPHFANRSFFYLTGIEQAESILLIYKHNSHTRTALFIASSDVIHERWNGRRLTRDEAAARSGLDDIAYLEGFSGIMADLAETGPVRLWFDLTADNPQAHDLRDMLERQAPHLVPNDLSPLLTQLRMIKQPEELALIREAAKLTGEGVMAILQACRPGIMEYQLCSEFQYTLSQAGCLEPAFPSIVAAGDHIMCLHHMDPVGQVQAGDLVLVDVGATTGGLCADISRVFPASGRFSERQLAIYELVRSCQEMAFATIRPGIRLADINEACRAVARDGLIRLGIMQAGDSVTDYFWHGVSHHLGLDVHDICNREALLQPGMVLTVEPGVYVPAWSTGLRIEDDVVVTADGCQLLSAGIPREASEIEALMQG